MGVRTPLLLRWPGRIVAGEFDTPVSTVDVAPTLLDAAGLEALAADLPGASLLPAAEGRERPAREAVFGEDYDPEARALLNARSTSNCSVSVSTGF